MCITNGKGYVVVVAVVVVIAAALLLELMLPYYC